MRDTRKMGNSHLYSIKSRGQEMAGEGRDRMGGKTRETETKKLGDESAPEQEE